MANICSWTRQWFYGNFNGAGVVRARARNLLDYEKWTLIPCVDDHPYSETKKQLSWCADDFHDALMSNPAAGRTWKGAKTQRVNHWLVASCHNIKYSTYDLAGHSNRGKPTQSRYSPLGIAVFRNHVVTWPSYPSPIPPIGSTLETIESKVHDCLFWQSIPMNLIWGKFFTLLISGGKTTSWKRIPKKTSVFLKLENWEKK